MPQERIARRLRRPGTGAVDRGAAYGNPRPAVGQVDFARRAITVLETKNGEIRSLPLVGHAFDLMEERAKVRRIDTDLVFPGRKKNRPVDLRTPFETAVKRAGIEDFRWHDLRHSAASYLAMNGATLAEIAEVLGHKTLAMVKRYSHLSQAHTTRVWSP